jgi:putrescine aminotransferase
MVRDHCIARGLMVRAVRDAIVMSPPLVITHAELDRLVDTIRAALDAAQPDLAGSDQRGPRIKSGATMKAN